MSAKSKIGVGKGVSNEKDIFIKNRQKSAGQIVKNSPVPPLATSIYMVQIFVQRMKIGTHPRAIVTRNRQVCRKDVVVEKMHAPREPCWKMKLFESEGHAPRAIKTRKRQVG